MPAFRSQLAPTNGDYRYPEDADRYGYNAADLRELRVAASDSKLHLLIALQTMKVADAAAAIVAIDTDGKAETGAPAWPDGAGISTPGADRFVTVWCTGGHVAGAQGAPRPITAASNLVENAIEADVPLDALGPIADSARIWVATGLAKAGGGGFAPQAGETAIFNVGFRGDDDWPRLVGHWGEHEQSQALANGEISMFAHSLRIGDLRARRDVPFKLEPGFYNRQFRSAHEWGEGIDLKDEGVGGSPEPQFKSRWQPYGLYVPKGYDPARRAPLLLNGHSLDVNHNEYRDVGPNQLVALGDDRGSITITPLARGIDTWYLESGLVDVMEAWEDVRRHYAIDDERTSITGYSMGGYMTYRMGLLMPDRFVRASVYVGPPAFSIWPYPAPPQSDRTEWVSRGFTNKIVPNALNLPFEITHGDADELVPIAGVLHQTDTFREAGNPYRFHHHSSDDHLSFILADRWGHTEQWLGDARIDRSPTRVRYRRYPAMDLPKYGLRFDRAYWATGLDVREIRDEESFGEIDATTFARGGHEMKPVVTRGPDTAPVGISPAVITEQKLVPGAAIEKRNGFAATLTNLRNIRFDTRAMGLDLKQPLTVTLRGDGATKVRLSGKAPKRVKTTLDGAALRLYRRKGEVRMLLNLAPGRDHTLKIAR